jgi:hypothetical protein
MGRSCVAGLFLCTLFLKKEKKMENSKILTIVVLAMALMLCTVSTALGAVSLTVNGQDVTLIELEQGRSCTVEVVSDDGISYVAYLGFDDGVVLGDFSHLETRPEAGNLATAIEYEQPDFYGYYLSASGFSPAPSAGVHFTFEYVALQLGETELKLYNDTFTSVIDSVNITVIPLQPVAMGSAFTYQGRLSDTAGPADGLYDFSFKLYDNPDLVFAAQQGPAIDVEDLDVVDGYFTVELDFGGSVFNGDARWLEIAVRPGETNDPNAFMALTPRQEVTPTPYALQTRGIFVDDDGNVGIGMTNPNALLDIEGVSPNLGLTSTSGLSPSITFDHLGSPGSGSTIGSIYFKWGVSNPVAGIHASAGSDSVNQDNAYLRFRTASEGIPIERMRINEDGNVGIGTPSPAEKLEVDGTVKATAFVGDGSGLTNPPSDSDWTVSGINMYSAVSGNVGIGTDTPGAKLDVESDYGQGGAATIGSSTNSAAGDYAVAMGYSTTAGGTYSTAMGAGTTAGGGYSTAMGAGTTAGGDYSTAMGIGTTASGTSSTAMGSGTNASGVLSTAMGIDTTASGYCSTAMGYDTTASGLASTAMGYDTTAGGDYSTVMGFLTNAVGSRSTAVGSYTDAGGYCSTAMGYNTTAGGSRSTAVGSYTDAGGDFSTAMGYYTTAGGDYSTAMGFNTIASGDFSTAMGSYTTAIGENSTAMGREIEVVGQCSVAIGLDDTYRSVTQNNTMAILGGNVGIGTTSPAEKLEVDGTVQVRKAQDAAGPVLRVSRIFTKPTIGSNYTEIDATSFNAYSKSLITSGTTLRLNDVSDGNVLLAEGGGNVGIGREPAANKLEVEGNASKSVAGDWLANSDARIKADIETVSDALETLDKVRLVSFKYTDDYQAKHPSIEQRRYVNVIAQEFGEVFPDYVKSSKEKLPNGDEILQVDAYPLTVYSAAAVQELHAIVKAKDAEIAAMKKRLAKMEAAVSKLISSEQGGQL